MAGNIYTAQFGEDGYLWDEGRTHRCVMVALDTQFFSPWKAGDREAMLAVFTDERPGSDPADVKGEATRWYNIATKIAESEGDIWLHFDGTDLFWAETTSEPFFEVPHQEPGRAIDAVAIAKPVTAWTNLNGKGARLSWISIHPKAKPYLALRQTVAQVQDPDMQRYVRELVSGGDLSEWHDRSDWKKRNSDLVLQATFVSQAVFMMRRYMQGEDLYPDGRVSISTSKPKRLLVDATVMDSHLTRCINEQRGCCKITGIPFQFPRQEGAEADFFPSPDRIDSDGDYEPSNVQVVCRFVNFWKGARNNEEFTSLLTRVARSPAFRGASGAGC